MNISVKKISCNFASVFIYIFIYIYIYIFIFILWGGLYGCNKITDGEGPANKNVGEVIRQDVIQKISVGGTVEAKRRTLITAPYNGYIQKLFVKVGDKVKAGDPLVSVAQTSDANAETVFPLRAPYAGVVVQVHHYEGEFIKEADMTDYIVRIDDLSKMYITAMVAEVDRMKIKEGMDAIIKVTAIGDKKYNGIVRYLSLASQEKDRWERSSLADYMVRLEILDADSKIMPGLSVVFDIITNKKEKVLTISHDYVVKEGENYYVTLVDGKQSKRTIKVGLQNEDLFEVTEGLAEKDKVMSIDFSTLIKDK